MANYTWCVIAHNSDEEYWAYGPLDTHQEAEDLATKLADAPLGNKIEYEIGELFSGKDMMDGEQENNPAA